MTFEIIFYVLLGMYLDQVLPSEYGVNKHPLFCLMRKKKEARDIAHDLEYNIQSHEKDPANFEDVDPNLTAQDQRNDSIQVKGLKKIYPNGKLAVDGVSYNMYQGQIFALLGHNGAGKTSTINMITGLYPATAGTVKVFDMDIHENLDDVR
jgi:ATP-binding cassette subfamily A (ABC1) protein 3